MLILGKAAPEFTNMETYENGAFGTLSSSDLKGTWTVLFFYPRDFTFVCPTELRGFARHMEDFKALNCGIVAASTDSHHSHKAWFGRDLKEVTYPILADVTHAVSRSFNVLNEETGAAERGLFILDEENVVRYVVLSSDSVGRSVKETLRVLKALQSGELCPIEWEEGDETLGKA